MTKTAITKKSAKNAEHEAAHTAVQKKQHKEKEAHDAAQADEKTQRKEQAKQEAKLMLKIEEARQDVNKAEQKLAKAQVKLAEAQARQQELEDKLDKLHATQHESHNGVPATSNEPLTSLAQPQEMPAEVDATQLSLETPFITQSAGTADMIDTTTSTEASEGTPLATSLEPDQPPAEGRTDITETAQQDSADIASSTDIPSALAPESVSETVAFTEQESAEASATTHEEETDEPGSSDDASQKSATTHRRTRRTHTEPTEQ